MSETDRECENKFLLEPYQYICNLPGPQIRPELIKAFNFWLQIPEDKLVIIEDLVEMLHSASLLIDDIEDNSKLRAGVPVAHHIYGIPLTMNAANYIYFLAMQKALTLDHHDVATIFVEHMLQFHQGQGMEIWWRENFVSPSEDEYRQMVLRKCGSLFHLSVTLMELFSSSTSTSNFDHLCQLLPLFFQLRDDYSNLTSTNSSMNKGFCEDLTEGKFSFPILHAVNTRDTDTRIIHILKQRTQNPDLKRYCIELLHEFGSMEYTQRTCENLAQEIFNEIDRLGGNEHLETLLRQSMDIFPLPSNGHESYVLDQVEDETH